MRSTQPVVRRIERIAYAATRARARAEFDEEVGETSGRRARVRGGDKCQFGIADGRRPIFRTQKPDDQQGWQRPKECLHPAPPRPQLERRRGWGWYRRCAKPVRRPRANEWRGCDVLLVSVCGYLLWFHLLTVSGATTASAYHFLMPPLGMVFGWILLGERVAWSDLIGVIPVALGIYLVTRAGRPRREREKLVPGSRPVPAIARRMS